MKKSNLFLYILLNVIVSAATTLAVLTVWDQMRKADLGSSPVSASIGAPNGAVSSDPVAGISTSAPVPTPEPTSTLPPADQPVIQILNVVGAGDLSVEVVMLKRVGEGNLPMPNWKLVGENGSEYVFPSQPALVLYQDGAVMIYSKPGTDTATEVYWNREQPAWRSGEMIRLLDSQGTERAAYQVP